MSNYGTPTGTRMKSMPGLNGTGPHGIGPMSGRRFGRCRTIVEPAKESAVPVQKANEISEPAISPGSAQNIPVYGRGRGGIPCGCGRGYGVGVGRRIG
jgi:hypothetical protein